MKDDTAQSLREIAARIERILGEAQTAYSHEVDALIHENFSDPERIEHLLDGLLDFCFDPEMPGLYKRLLEGGRVFVFSPEEGFQPGHFRQAAQTAERVMRHHDDFMSLGAVSEYFRTLYWMKGEKLDEYQILDDLGEGAKNGDFPFRIVDEKFKLIKDGAESIIIPWNEEAEKIISGLRYSQCPACLARKAQRFTVQVYPKVLGSLERAGSVERLHGQHCREIQQKIPDKQSC
jgi:hypothetical protein